MRLVDMPSPPRGDTRLQRPTSPTNGVSVCLDKGLPRTHSQQEAAVQDGNAAGPGGQLISLALNSSSHVWRPCDWRVTCPFSVLLSQV